MKKAPDMDLKREIAGRIKKIRKNAGLSQEKFAQSISVSRVHLNRMEAPEIEMMPSKPVLERICICYHVEKEWLMTGNGSMYAEGYDILGEKEDYFETTNAAYRKQCIEYTTLKMTDLLKRGDMESSIFAAYFHFVMQHTGDFFDFLTNAKEQLKTTGKLPEEEIHKKYM